MIAQTRLRRRSGKYSMTNSRLRCRDAAFYGRASRKKDTKKVEELAQSIDELETKLGPEYPLLLDRLWNIDPTSRDSQEILSILNKLDEFCG
jgi:hypothetical protein